jgi:DNA-binding beta-propeller fold protein YncE
MTGFALHQSGDLYVGLATCDPATHGIWRVRQDGSHTELFASLPVQDLPKGLAFTNGDFPLYVTNLHDFRPEKSRAHCQAALATPDPHDDCALNVWRIDSTGKVVTWVESALLYGHPDSPLEHPHGVSGVVVDHAGAHVYVTVTDFGRVVQIPLINDGSAGTPEVIFESEPDQPAAQRALFGIDGITIGPDGNFYVVVARTDELVVIRPGASTHTVLVHGHPLDGPTQLAFGPDDDHQNGQGAQGQGRQGDGDDAGVKPLPPLYLVNGAGRRSFFVTVARALGQGDLLSGVSQLVDMGIITEEEAIDLQPRPSLVRVLLGTRTTGRGGD